MQLVKICFRKIGESESFIDGRPTKYMCFIADSSIAEGGTAGRKEKKHAHQCIRFDRFFNHAQPL
jgi:hypothetical protein